MHAFLFFRNEDIQQQLTGYRTQERTLKNVSDLRDFQKELRLQATTPTAYILREADNFSAEVYSPLLKLLEEPEEKTVFFLQIQDIKHVPATILSRCQLLKAFNTQLSSKTYQQPDFLNGDRQKAILELYRIKDRATALEVLKQAMLFYHQQLVEKPTDIKSTVANLSLLDTAYKNISSNGALLLNLIDLSLNLRGL